MTPEPVSRARALLDDDLRAVIVLVTFAFVMPGAVAYLGGTPNASVFAVLVGIVMTYVVNHWSCCFKPRRDR